MNRDILDKYRRAQEESLQVETVEGKPYKAFQVASTQQRRFDLRPGHIAQRLISYAFLTDVIHAGGVIVGLSISVPRLRVRIEGRNLQSLVDALREEKVTAIEEYLPQRHQKPEASEPVIHKLLITTQGAAAKHPATTAKH